MYVTTIQLRMSQSQYTSRNTTSRNPSRRSEIKESHNDEPRGDDKQDSNTKTNVQTKKHDNLPFHEPSICIPRAHVTVQGRNIREVVRERFIELGIGRIDRIDSVYKNNDRGEKFCTIYIHMKYWNTKNKEGVKLRNLLLEGEEVKIVYDDPWFWKCTASRLPKPDDRRSAPKAKIIYDESDTRHHEHDESDSHNSTRNARSISPCSKKEEHPVKNEEKVHE